MTIVQKQRALHAIAAAAWCGTIAIAAAGVAMNRAAAVPTQLSVTTRPTTRLAATTTPAVDAEALQAISRIKLRRPVKDTPSDAPLARAPTTAPVVAVALALKGTILEAGGTPYAVLLIPGGRTAIASVGDQIEGADVIRIERDRVTLRYGSGPSARTTTLSAPRPRGEQ